MITICHLTSVHPRYDIRIFHKQCLSLYKNGYSVNLIVADGQGDELKNGVNIIDVGKIEGRIKRILFSSYKVYKKALLLKADIYHFHDPELLPYGYLLQLKKKKVIYDAHEDLPRQLLTKPYLSDILKKLTAFLAENIENLITKSLTGIIGATPFITERFKKNNTNTININNFPLIEEKSIECTEQIKKYDLVYVGHISKLRGFDKMCTVTKKLNVSLALAGSFSPLSLNKNIDCINNISYLGYLNKQETFELLQKSRMGMVLLSQTQSYLTSLPVKMFEYLWAGIPVIASNFPLWKEIVEKNRCGICVNPESSEEIEDAVRFLIENPTIALEMGERGRKLILNQYNWAIEEKKLIDFYENIL